MWSPSVANKNPSKVMITITGNLPQFKWVYFTDLERAQEFCEVYNRQAKSSEAPAFAVIVKDGFAHDD